MDTNELKNAMDMAGYKLPNHVVRDLLAELKAQGKVGADARVSKDVVKEVRFNLFFGF